MTTYFTNFKKGIVVILWCITASSPHAQQLIFDPIYYYLEGLVNDTNIEDENYITQENDFINSKEMALELAEIYIKNVFGKNTANREKPYLIAEDKTKWIISGQKPQTLHSRYSTGGPFLIVISKIDGKVISLIKDR